MNDNQFLNHSESIIHNETIPAATSIELNEQGILGDNLSEGIHSEWLQPLINGDLALPEARKRKEIIAKAIIKGINEGVIAPMRPEEIAALIDEGLTRIIVARQVGDDVIETIEAMDVLIDHAAARVVTIADGLITKVENGLLQKSDVIADTIVDRGATALKVVASAFPPTRVLVPFIDTAAQYIKPAARVIVKKGISLVANVARTVVKKAVPFIADKVKQAGRAVKNWVKSLF